MAVRGARMILWIALQFLAVLSCSLHSVFPASFYSAVHNCTSMCFFYSFDSKVLFSRCVNTSPQRALDSLTLCPFLFLWITAAHLSSIFSAPENLFIYQSPFITLLCVWITCLLLHLHCSCPLQQVQPSGTAVPSGERDEGSRVWLSLRHYKDREQSW